MIVVYDYANPAKTIRYTEVAVIREQLDGKHVLKLKNGKWVTPRQGWIAHEVKLSKSEELAFTIKPGG